VELIARLPAADLLLTQAGKLRGTTEDEMTRPANAKVPAVPVSGGYGKPSGRPGGDIGASWRITRMQGQMHVHSLRA